MLLSMACHGKNQTCHGGIKLRLVTWSRAGQMILGL